MNIVPRILRSQPQHHTMKTTITPVALALVAICGFAAGSAVAGAKATFKLETTSTPKVLVVQRDQPADAKPDRTPYELDGDTLKIAFTSPDQRSIEVSDKGQMLFTLKRKKP